MLYNAAIQAMPTRSKNGSRQHRGTLSATLRTLLTVVCYLMAAAYPGRVALQGGSALFVAAETGKLHLALDRCGGVPVALVDSRSATEGGWDVLERCDTAAGCMASIAAGAHHPAGLHPVPTSGLWADRLLHHFTDLPPPSAT